MICWYCVFAQCLCLIVPLTMHYCIYAVSCPQIIIDNSSLHVNRCFHYQYSCWYYIYFDDKCLLVEKGNPYPAQFSPFWFSMQDSAFVGWWPWKRWSPGIVFGSYIGRDPVFQQRRGLCGFITLVGVSIIFPPGRPGQHPWSDKVSALADGGPAAPHQLRELCLRWASHCSGLPDQGGGDLESRPLS